MVESVGANLVSTILLAHGLLICGASYSTFEDIRYKHFRHHVDNDDVVWFDYEKFFLSHPRILAGSRCWNFSTYPRTILSCMP